MKRLARWAVSTLSKLSYWTGAYPMAVAINNSLMRMTGYTGLFSANIRPRWILAGALSKKAIALPLHFAPADSVPASIVPRIIAAFNANTRPEAQVVAESGVSNLWSDNLSRRWKHLISAIWKNDEREVSRILANMFQSDFIWGLASNGNLIFKRPHLRPIVATSTVLGLVQMGEALGTVRAETSEQGSPLYALQNGAGRVLEGLEVALGTDLSFPQISGAYGYLISGKFIVPSQFTHIYAAWKIKQHIENSYPTGRAVRIVEIGGGYGALCYWLQKFAGDRISTYTIVDLPSTAVPQAYFLAKTLGPDKVGLLNARDGTFDVQAPIRLVPHFALNQVEATDIVINQDSFPEVPETEVDRYLDWMLAHTDWFLSFNQEAYSPVSGVPQTLVPERCSMKSGLRRVSRHKSFVRDGYVEEVYKTLGRV